MPEGIWGLFDEETTAKLFDPHPNVVIRTASNLEQFTDIASQSAGVLVGRFGMPKEVLQSWFWDEDITHVPHFPR